MFTFGTDPEFFLLHEGVFHSAIPVVGHDKNNPTERNGNLFYYDNVLAEMAVKPASSAEEAVSNIREGLRDYSLLIWPYFLGRIAYASLSDSQLLHPDARNVGCKTEWCAYDIAEKIGPVETIKKGNIRTAGGHVHLGGSPVLLEGHGQLATVRMLDLFLSAPLVLIDRGEDSKSRKKFYGQAGRHRHPAHGLEYRTPGNFWLANPSLVELVFNICEWVVKFVEDGGHKEYWTLDDNWTTSTDQKSCHHCIYDVNRLRQCIDTNDEKDAYFWFCEAKKKLPERIVKKITTAVPPNHGLYREWGI